MRNRLIQLVHVAKRELNLDEDIYRSVLSDLTDKSSCAKMSIKELEVVIEHFKTVGFKVKARKRYSPKATTNTVGQVAKLRAVWINMHKQGIVRDSSEQALDSYITRMLQGKSATITYHAQFLTPKQAVNVLESLKRWQKRAAKENETL